MFYIKHLVKKVALFFLSLRGRNMFLIERQICIIMYCFGYHCIIVVFAHAQSAHNKMSM